LAEAKWLPAKLGLESIKRSGHGHCKTRKRLARVKTLVLVEEEEDGVHLCPSFTKAVGRPSGLLYLGRGEWVRDHFLWCNYPPPSSEKKCRQKQTKEDALFEVCAGLRVRSGLPFTGSLASDPYIDFEPVVQQKYAL
jgi:hypothetical protein